MKDMIFILFETDVFKTKSSRVLKGVFTSRELAEEHAIINRIESTISSAEIIEVETNIYSDNI